jgi:hypothetical protein
MICPDTSHLNPALQMQISDRLYSLKTCITFDCFRSYVLTAFSSQTLENYQPSFVWTWLRKETSCQPMSALIRIRLCGTRITILERLLVVNLTLSGVEPSCASIYEDLATKLFTEFDELTRQRSEDPRKGGKARQALYDPAKAFVIEELKIRQRTLRGKRESRVAALIWEDVSDRFNDGQRPIRIGKSLRRTIRNWLMEADSPVRQAYRDLLVVGT